MMTTTPAHLTEKLSSCLAAAGPTTKRLGQARTPRARAESFWASAGLLETRVGIRNGQPFSEGESAENVVAFYRAAFASLPGDVVVELRVVLGEELDQLHDTPVVSSMRVLLADCMGAEDGAKHAEAVYNEDESGPEQLRQCQRNPPWHWQSSARGAGAARAAGVPEHLEDVYYAAYEHAAVAATERLLDA